MVASTLDVLGSTVTGSDYIGHRASAGLLFADRAVVRAARGVGRQHAGDKQKDQEGWLHPTIVDSH